MDDYKIIVEQEHQTVMAHYDVEPKPADGYQSEAASHGARHGVISILGKP